MFFFFLFSFIWFRFDFETNEWNDVAPITTPRNRPSHVVHSGRLYVLGGYDDADNAFNSVEYYDPSTDQWQAVAPMLEERAIPAVCVSQGFIYALGGMTKRQILHSVERYNPDENTWTKVFIKWEIYWFQRNKITHISSSRFQMEFVLPSDLLMDVTTLAVGDWVYFAGGRACFGTALKVFIKFNVVTGQAVNLPDLPTPLAHADLLKYWDFHSGFPRERHILPGK